MGLYFNAVDWLARMGGGKSDELELALAREEREAAEGAWVRVAGNGLDMAVPKV